MAEATSKSVRIIAARADQKGKLRTVNIKTDAKRDQHKGHTQLTAAQTQVGIHETVMDSGGQIAGLPTIYVSGYSAPD